MKRRKQKSAQAEQTKEYTSIGLIFFLLDQLWSFLSKRISGGFFGKILTSYSKEQKAFNNGYIKNHFSGNNRLMPIIKTIRYHISRVLENSWFLCRCRAITKRFTRVSLKTIGGAWFSFGVYTVVVYFVRLLLPNLSKPDLSVALTGVGLCIIAIPMLLSKESVASAVGNSVIPRMLFSNVFGVREENFTAEEPVQKSGSVLFVLSGLLFGLLTLFVHPLWITVWIFLLIGVCLIFASPEIGVVSTVFLLPFYSIFENASIIFSLMVLIIGFSYLLKLLRGKRILRMELMDLSVLAFLLVMFFSGTITAGGKKGYYEVLLFCSLMLGYFLVVNLMRTAAWLTRLIYAFMSSGTVVAILGILQYAFGALSVDHWIDLRYFAEIRGRATSVFDNPNVLGMFLCMVFPFALFALKRSKQKNERFLCRISVILILLCTILTWSRGAWLAILLTGLLFAMFSSKKVLRGIFLCLLAIPFVSILLPEPVIHRFLSIGNLGDSSLQYRLYTWKGSLKMLKDHLWGGIGYGNTAFCEIYPQYAYAGMEAAEHSHNLFLQIAVGTGIGGLLLFLTVLLLGYQMNLEYVKKSTDPQTKLMVIAALCSFTAILIMGLFDFVWYNYRVMFLFWVVLGIACAGTRIGETEQRRNSYILNANAHRASIDLEL